MRAEEEWVCIGFGENEGRCENVAGTPWTPIWCLPCDEERRAHITRQMERISKSFVPQPPLARDPEWPLVEEC